MKQITNILKATTQLFLNLENSFLNEPISLILSRFKFIIYYVQLFSLVFGNSKHFQHAQSKYLYNLVQFVSLYPTLNLINQVTNYLIFYLISILLITLLMLITLAIYKNYFNQREQQNNLIFQENHYIYSKLVLEKIFQLWQYIFLIPLNDINFSCLKQSDNEFKNIIGIMNLSVIFMITLLISIFQRQHQFKENVELEQFNNINIIIPLCIQLLSLMQYFDQILIQHLIYLLIILINLYQGIERFSYGFTSLQNLIIKLNGISFIFQIYNIFWIYTEITDDSTFFVYFISIPVNIYILQQYQFILVICETTYRRQLLYNLQLYILDPTQIRFANASLKYLYQITQKTSQSNNLIIIHTLFMQHISICQNIKCPIRLKSEYQDQWNQINNKTIEKYIQYQYLQMISKIKYFEQNPLIFEIIAMNSFTFSTYFSNFLLTYTWCQQINNKIKSNQLQHLQSSYFRQSTQIIKQHCIQKIYQKNLQQVTLTKEEYLIQYDIIKLIQVEDIYISQLNSILKLYQKLFSNYLNGLFHTFQDVFTLIKQIYNLNLKILRSTNCQIPSSSELKRISIYELRLQFLINMITNYDSLYIVRLANQLTSIQEDIHHDATKPFFNNSSFLDMQGISIIGNLLNGFLLNAQNKSINNFFQYDPLIQLTRAEQLMPRELATIHQGMVDRYVQTGLSTRLNNIGESFIQNAGGFIENCQLFFSNYFSQINQEDLLLIVFVKKTHKNSQDSGYILITEDQQIFGITQNLFSFITDLPIQSRNQDQSISLLNSIYKSQLIDIAPIISESIKYKSAEYCENQKMNGTIIQRSVKSQGRSKRQLFAQQLQEIPIQFTFEKLIYYPLINGQESQTVFYQIFIQYEQNIQQMGKNNLKQLYFNHQKTIQSMKNQSTQRIVSQTNISPLQTVRLASENNEKANMKRGYDHDLDQSGEHNQFRSKGSFQDQIRRLLLILNSRKFSKPIIKLISKVILELCLFLFFICLFSLLFIEKSQIQTSCLYNCDFDINYLDAYSQLFFGVRHMIYYRDFYQILTDNVIQYNSTYLNISKYDFIIYSYTNLRSSLAQIVSNQDDFQKMILLEEPMQMQIKLLDYDQTIYDQEVQSRAEFNQVMYVSFFWSSITFASSPTVFLSGATDVFQIVFTRSQLVLNFFTMAEVSSQKVDHCQEFNSYINDKIDNLGFASFLAFYIIFILIALLGPIFYIKTVKQFKRYLLFFNQLTTQDLVYTLEYYGQLKDLLSVPQLCFSTRAFDQLIKISTNQMEYHNNQHNSYSHKFSNKIKQTISDKFYVLVLGLLFIFNISYGIFNQVYYQIQSDSVTPIFSKAIETERIRLNFILAMSYWDTYLQQKYYFAYNQSKTETSYWSQNIEQNLNFIKYINISEDTVQNYITKFNTGQINQLVFSLESDLKTQIDDQTIQMFGFKDLCLLTGCSMIEELVDRPYFENFIGYFENGIIQLEKQINKIFKDNQQLLDPTLSNLEFIKLYNKMQKDLDYFLIYLWGIDAFTLQMQQFSNFFLYLSQNSLQQRINQNIFFIIFFGSAIIIIYSITWIILIQKLIFKQQVLKYSIKYIPMQIIYERKIIQQIIMLERKNN